MSVTAVPLRPIPRRALILLWIGIVLLVFAGAAIAWRGTADPNAAFFDANADQAGVVTTASGLQYQVLREGQGPKPTDSDVALVGYRGTLLDGTEFDANPQAPMPVAGVVPGFSEGLKLMGKGARYRFWIPPALGYGAETKRRPDGSVAIPGNSVLVFEVELQDFLPEALIRQMQMQMQQGGAPGGPPPVPAPPQ